MRSSWQSSSQCWKVSGEIAAQPSLQGSTQAGHCEGRRCIAPAPAVVL